MGCESETLCNSFVLLSKSGVSSTLILLMDIESSLDKFVIETACDPYPLELDEGVFDLGANSLRESKVRDIGSDRLTWFFFRCTL